MKCYRQGGCGPYEMTPCGECPYSKPQPDEKLLIREAERAGAVITRTDGEGGVYVNGEDFDVVEILKSVFDGC